nr:hypothetical protein MtrDRAFT_AC157473g37v2 [Medicago truncatula]
MIWPLKLNRLLKKPRPSLFKNKGWPDMAWSIPIPIHQHVSIHNPHPSLMKYSFHLRSLL